jgi:hypothetical protein
MTSLRPGSRKRHSGEEGYVLIGVIFLCVLILISLSVAASRIAVEIQRDKEAELIHRGKQYTRAIRLYYRKFGRYPISVAQLENTNNIKFLRKKYKDPFTGKDEWRVIHFGEAKVPTTGLFGQSLTPTSSGTSGTSTTGGSYSPGQSALGASITSSTLSSTPGASSTNTGTSGTGTTSDSGSSFGRGVGNSVSPTSGSTIGGGAMIGVASMSRKASIKEFKKQKHYNEWEFVYDPLLERLTGGNGTSVMAPTNNGNSLFPSSSTPTSGTSSPFGSSSGGTAPPNNQTTPGSPTPQ